jgi:hypothetical protein
MASHAGVSGQAARSNIDVTVPGAAVRIEAVPESNQRRPDPFLPHHPGRYDLTTTQGNTIRIWTLPTRDGLKPAQPVTVWSDNTPSRCRSIRAAELHSPGRPRWTAPVPERHR